MKQSNRKNRMTSENFQDHNHQRTTKAKQILPYKKVTVPAALLVIAIENFPTTLLHFRDFLQEYRQVFRRLAVMLGATSLVPVPLTLKTLVRATNALKFTPLHWEKAHSMFYFKCTWSSLCVHCRNVLNGSRRTGGNFTIYHNVL